MLELTYFGRNIIHTTLRVVLVENELNNAFETIPNNISMLTIDTFEGASVEALPNMNKFTNLKSIKINGLHGLRQLPNIPTLNQVIIRECSIETLHNIPDSIDYLTLDNNPNLDMYTLPQSIGVFICSQQRLGHFTIPQDNVMTSIYDCSLDTITNIDLCQQYADELPWYVFDMWGCNSPYQSYIDDVLYRMDLAMYTRDRIQSLSRTLLPYIIDIVKHREAVLEFANTMSTVRDSIRTSVPQDKLSPCDTVFILASNYPRRMMEYM